MNEIPKPVSDYMSAIGKKGGSAGKGSKKKRSAAHYQKMVASRKRKAKRK